MRRPRLSNNIIQGLLELARNYDFHNSDKAKNSIMASEYIKDLSDWYEFRKLIKFKPGDKVYRIVKTEPKTVVKCTIHSINHELPCYLIENDKGQFANLTPDKVFKTRKEAQAAIKEGE